MTTHIPERLSRRRTDFSGLTFPCYHCLLPQPLARLGAEVTGVDASATNIGVAEQHASLDSSLHSLQYRCCTVEDMVREQDESQTDGRFDIVIASEVIEHVADPPGFVRSCKNLTRVRRKPPPPPPPVLCERCTGIGLPWKEWGVTGSLCIPNISEKKTQSCYWILLLCWSAARWCTRLHNNQPHHAIICNRHCWSRICTGAGPARNAWLEEICNARRAAEHASVR